MYETISRSLWYIPTIFLDYTEKWANARLEQQELKLYLEKMNMLNKLSDCSKEYNAEQIISAEINVHVENDIKEKEERIIEWTGKYNDEIEERQQEIDELRVRACEY